MHIFMRIVRSFVSFVILSSLLTMAVWYFFGSITITATLNGEDMTQATVKVDGKRICKTTPCTFRPLPGFHRIVVTPTDDDTDEPDVRWNTLTFNLGASLEAKFHYGEPAVRVPSSEFSAL